MFNKILFTLFVLMSFGAHSSVVVIAHPSLSDLDSATIKKVYLGKAKSLPVMPIELEDGVLLKKEFHKKVTGKTEAQLQAYWAKKIFTGKGKPPESVASSTIMKNKVASINNAIGYIDEGDVDSSVKVIFRP